METLQTGKAVAGQRNAGIDLLRILAALYIIVLHTLGMGGILENVAEGSYQEQVSDFLYFWSFCGVNIFGLISGYVGYSEKEKPIAWKSMASLWLEVVFYDVSMALLALRILPDRASTADLPHLFFPILNNSHWYFTCYAALLLFIPFLNSGVRQCSCKTLLQFLGAIFLVVIPIDTLFGHFHFYLGYSVAWLIVLYLVGAILKKTNIGAKLPTPIAIIGIVLMDVLSVWFFRNWVETTWFGYSISPAMARYFTFPCHYISAVLHLIVFSRLKLGPVVGKWISALAPGAFAVYLINTQKHYWLGYLPGRYWYLSNSSPLGIFVRVIAYSVLFVSVCLVVDFIRRQLIRLLRRKKT